MAKLSENKKTLSEVFLYHAAFSCQTIRRSISDPDQKVLNSDPMSTIERQPDAVQLPLKPLFRTQKMDPD